MSQRKPGKLKTNRIAINLDAMKPGAVNPLIRKRRQTEIKRKSVNKDLTKRNRSKSRPQYINNAVSAKLNQVTITAPRRKASRKSSKSFLIDSTPSVPTYFCVRLSPPSAAIPSLDLSSSEKSVSLMHNMIPTPFGLDNNDIDVPTPLPPSTPTPPPPPPPNHIQMKSDGSFGVLCVPPAPPPPVLTSINKAPRDTASSTTFTISGQKITVIGHARTGKTSLKNALFGRSFEEMTFPTVKAPLTATIVVTSLDEADINVAYEVWDTPGQKVLECIPPLYITGSFCVLVVYDITDRYSYCRAKYWIHYLEQNAKGYDNVVLCGNKYDLEQRERCVASDEVNHYAQKHNIFFIEISVKTKYNFDVLLAWLNGKTQEQFIKKMELMEEEIGYDEWKLVNDKEEIKEKKKKRKIGHKEWIKIHQRHLMNHKPIELDKIDVHSRNRKGRGCCLW